MNKFNPIFNFNIHYSNNDTDEDTDEKKSTRAPNNINESFFNKSRFTRDRESQENSEENNGFSDRSLSIFEFSDRRNKISIYDKLIATNRRNQWPQCDAIRSSLIDFESKGHGDQVYNHHLNKVNSKYTESSFDSESPGDFCKIFQSDMSSGNFDNEILDESELCSTFNYEHSLIQDKSNNTENPLSRSKFLFDRIKTQEKQESLMNVRTNCVQDRSMQMTQSNIKSWNFSVGEGVPEFSCIVISHKNPEVDHPAAMFEYLRNGNEDDLLAKKSGDFYCFHGEQGKTLNAAAKAEINDALMGNTRKDHTSPCLLLVETNFPISGDHFMFGEDKIDYSNIKSKNMRIIFFDQQNDQSLDQQVETLRKNVGEEKIMRWRGAPADLTKHLYKELYSGDQNDAQTDQFFTFTDSQCQDSR